jgi:hypothetical protein
MPPPPSHAHMPLTPAGLRSAIGRAVIEVAPDKARERRVKAERDARVQRWAEESGNAALAGRELPPAAVLAADQKISHRARQLKKAPGRGPGRGSPSPPQASPGRREDRGAGGRTPGPADSRISWSCWTRFPPASVTTGTRPKATIPASSSGT